MSELSQYEALLARAKEMRLDYNTATEEGYVFLEDQDEEPQDDNRQPDGPRALSIPVGTTTTWTSNVLSDSKNRLTLSALAKNDIPTVLTSRARVMHTPQTFNIRIPIEGAPITNQRASGRCWLFASTNVFRVALMKRYNLKEFELSQAWLFFWDKLEKSNWFLENVIDLAREEELDGRLMQEMLRQPISDGGQWDMVAAIVQKYGLVPQTLYPDSYSAMNSSTMNRLIIGKLREDAIKLRRIVALHLPTSKMSLSAKLTEAKTNMLAEVHRILTLMLGPPPSPNKKFSWNYYDADGRFHNEDNHTPITFADQLSDVACRLANHGTDVHKLFSLVHDPRNAYYTLLTVSRLGNVLPTPKPDEKPDFTQIRYVNVPMSVLKKAVITMLKEEHPVFFGCDVGKSSSSSLGIMAHNLIDYKLGFNVTLGLNKASRLQVGESAMTHAMVLTGVHVETVEVTDSMTGKKRREEQPVRWRVENSWGESAGEKGWFVMDDEWFSEWVYQAVVDPRYVSKDIRDVLDKEPTVLPFWDPMGALA